MADITNRTAVDGLDFYEIKSNLRRFLSSQDKFKDYNFEGSGLSILLDLLAYNTHYISYYTNMVANEMFLDTATVRDSVVSHAKLLGYTPNSNRAARAVVSLTVAAEEDGSVKSEFLPKNTLFSSKPVSNVSLNFLSSQTHQFEPKQYDENGIITQYWIPEIEIIEGKAMVSTFVVDRTKKPAQRFVIPQENVDISTLKVRVQASVNDISGYDEYWTRVTDPLQLDPTSKVYFIQETENQQFEVYFGDDIVGQAVQNGNVVILEYMVTSVDPTIANDVGANETPNSRTFTVDPSSGMSLTREVAVVSCASGGATRESIDSIKYYAPRGYQAQDRAVTTEDYAFMLAKEYPFAQSIYVWGGEDNTPPVYGKVFISIKPLRGTSLTNQEKEAIKYGILKRFNIVGVTPEIVDPDYTYLRFETTLKMNSVKTPKTPNDIRQIVKATVDAYVNENLGKFGGSLLLSRLATEIDASDPSIEASSTAIRLEKRIEPNYGVDTNYTTKFANTIQPNSLTTNAFLYFDAERVKCGQTSYSTSYLRDNGLGKLQVITYEPNLCEATPSAQTGEKPVRVLKADAGTINYETGQVDLPGFNIAGLAGVNPVLRITTTPSNIAEVVADRNQLLVVDSEDTTSNSVDVRQSTEGRLNSPASVRNQPRTQSQQQSQPTTASTTNNVAGQGSSSC